MVMRHHAIYLASFSFTKSEILSSRMGGSSCRDFHSQGFSSSSASWRIFEDFSRSIEGRAFEAGRSGLLIHASQISRLLSLGSGTQIVAESTRRTSQRNV